MPYVLSPVTPTFRDSDGSTPPSSLPTPLADLQAGAPPSRGSFANPIIPPLVFPLGGASMQAVRTAAPQGTYDNPSAVAVGNSSAFLGGGQYNIAANPSTLLKTPRGFDASTRTALRGGYFGDPNGNTNVPGGVTVDHIIPIALGGTNDLTNIHLLNNDDNTKKTTIDQLAIFLQSKGKISLAQARGLSQNWNNDPGALIPDSLLNDPELQKPIVFGDGTSFNIVDALRQTKTSKYQQSFTGDQTSVTAGSVAKDIAKNYPTYLGALPGMALKAIKAAPSLVNEIFGAPLYGALAGIFKGENVFKATEQYRTQAHADTTEPVAGGLPQGMYLKDPATNPVFEAAPNLIKGLTAGQVDPTSYTTQTYTDPTDQIVARVSGAIGQGLGAGLGIGLLGEAASTRLATGPLGKALINSRIGQALMASPAASKLASGMISSSLGMLSYGQLSNNQGRSWNVVENIKQRGEQALSDIGMGALFSLGGTYLEGRYPIEGIKGTSNILGIPKFTMPTAAYNMAKGTLAQGAAGFSISFLETGNYEASLTNAGTFMALHGYGLANAPEMHPDEVKNRAVAVKASTDFYKQFGIENVNSDAGAKKALVDLKTKLDIEVKEGRMELPQAKELLKRGVVASRSLYNYNLTPFQQMMNQGADIKSAWQKVGEERAAAKVAAVNKNKAVVPAEPVDVTSFTADHNTADFRQASKEMDMQKNAQFEPLYNDLNVHPDTLENVMPTGQGVNTMINQNQNFVVRTLQANPAADIQITYVREPAMPQNAFDPNAVAVKASINNGPDINIGYVPRQENIVNNQNALSLPKIQRLFPETQPFKEGSNNITFANQMDNLGIDRVEAKLLRAQVASGSENPYLITNVPRENWGKALELKPKLDQARNDRAPIINNRTDLFSHISSGIKRYANDIFAEMERHVQNNDSTGLGNYLNSFGEVLNQKALNGLEQNLNQFNYLNVIDLLENAQKRGVLNPEGKTTLDTINLTLEQVRSTLGPKVYKEFLAMPLASNTIPEASPAPVKEVAPEVANKVAVDAVEDPTPIKVFLNRFVPIEKQNILPGDFKTAVSEGRITGIAKLTINKIRDLMSQGSTYNDPKIKSLYNFYMKGLSYEVEQGTAKKSATAQDFINSYIKTTAKLGIDLSPTPTQTAELTRRYNLLKQTPSKSTQLFLSPKGDSIDAGLAVKEEAFNPREPESKLEELINNSKYSKIKDSNGNPQIRLMGMATEGKSENDQKFSGGVNISGNDAQIVKATALAMKEKNIYFVTNTNGVDTTSQGIYVGPEAKAELIKDFDKNPEKNTITDPEMLKNLKELYPHLSLDSPEFKVTQMLFKEILGAGTNFDHATNNKRANAYLGHDVKIDEDGTVRVFYFPDTPMGDIKSEGFLPKGFDVNDPRAQNFLTKKTIGDGGAQGTRSLFRSIFKFMGNTTEGMNTKGSIATALPDNQGLLTEKSNMSTLADSTRIDLENKHNIILKNPTHDDSGNLIKRNDPDHYYISFRTNVKIGKDYLPYLKDANGNPTNIQYYDVPKRSMRFIYKEVNDAADATFSLNGLAGKFSKDDFVTYDGQQIPVADHTVALFKPQVDKWNRVWNSVIKEGADPVEALKQNYNKDLNEIGYGKLKVMGADNGDIISLRQQFETQMNAIWQNSVLKNRDLLGSELRIIPDSGFFDPAIGKRRFLKARQSLTEMGEGMISQAKHDQMGNPEFILTNRYPNAKKLALSKVKVLIGEDYGHPDLGMDNMILNYHDLYIRKEGDGDGDEGFIYAIIPKNKSQAAVDRALKDGIPMTGITEHLADSIEQERERYIQQYGAEYGTQGIEGNPYPKLPAAFLETRLAIALPVTEAKSAVGGTSNAANMMMMFRDNMADPKIQELFTVKGVLYEPKAGFEQQDGIGQILQAELDAGKSQAFNQMSLAEKNAYSVIFGTKDIEILKQLRLNIMGSKGNGGDYGKGIRLGKMKSSSEMIDAAQAFLSASPQDEALLSPVQRILAPLKGAAKNTIFDHQKFASDLEATKAVKTEFPNIPRTENAQKFIDFIEKDWQPKKMKAILPQNKTKENQPLRNGEPVLDYFYEHMDKYSKADLESISFYLATDKQANIYYNSGYHDQNVGLVEDYKNGKGSGIPTKFGTVNVERFDDLMIPSHRRAYYKARQVWYKDSLLKPPVAPTVLPNSGDNALNGLRVAPPSPSTAPIANLPPNPIRLTAQGAEPMVPQTDFTKFKEYNKKLQPTKAGGAKKPTILKSFAELKKALKQ